MERFCYSGKRVGESARLLFRYRIIWYIGGSLLSANLLWLVSVRWQFIRDLDLQRCREIGLIFQFPFGLLPQL